MEVELLHWFRELDDKQQIAALTYLQDIAAGWTDATWTRLNRAPEGGLATMADDFVGLEKARGPWYKKADVPNETQESRHAEAMLEDNRQLQETIATRAASAPARTPAGVRSKARMIASYFRNDLYPDSDMPMGKLLRSMIEDAAGVTGGAA